MAPIRHLLFVVLTLCTTAAHAQWAGTWSGQLSGAPATLQLALEGQEMRGQIDAGGYLYTLSGKAIGMSARGNVTDVSTQGRVPFRAHLRGKEMEFIFDAAAIGGQSFTVLFTKGGQPPAAPPPATGNYQRDPRLVGRWTYTDSYTSGTYSFATRYRMQINPDGSYLYGDGKVAGGGGGVSGSSRGGEVERGFWRTENGLILISGDQQSWQPYAGYYLEANKLMLKFQDGSRQVWYRH